MTTTPKPIKLLKEILADADTVVTRGSTMDNIANLSPKFIKTVFQKYDGTRLGRQELYAEILEDVEGAMWNRAMLDALRRKPHEVPPLRRVVVGLDPAVSSGEDSDETGIIVVGLGVDGHAYVFEDLSGVYTPNDWSIKTIAAYRNPMRPADRVIGEVNNGGEMIEHTLRVVDPSVSYKSVHASHGKVTRAEPVSALYERKLVHHVGSFPILEDQMCEFTTGFDKKTAGYSPDRLDALVWAVTELKVESSIGGIFEFYKQQATELLSKNQSQAPQFGYSLAGGNPPAPNTPTIPNAMANQPRIEANTVRLLAPPNTSQVYGGLGVVYAVGSDRIITVSREDANALMAQGFTPVA
jgi:phage terminase large subunit-like protein